jgi:surface protein
MSSSSTVENIELINGKLDNNTIRICVKAYIHNKYLEEMGAPPKYIFPPELTENIGSWDVSEVTEMNDLFSNSIFNEDISGWDVSRVTNMQAMFFNCPSFNQPLNDWNVGQVTNMQAMFSNCISFNQPLNDWNVGQVTNMQEMFNKCGNFDQPLDNWDVSQVTDMSSMLSECGLFDQPLNNWKNKVGRVTNMNEMFWKCSSFNQPLGDWDVSNVETMYTMFTGCSRLDCNLNRWNVSKVKNMKYMFKNCYQFNDSLFRWNVSNVEDMSSMFYGCHHFNQPLNDWGSKLGNVKKMSEMFHSCYSFNQPLDSWNVANVTDMFEMFNSCFKFNQSLNNWNIQSIGKDRLIKYLGGMFKNCRKFDHKNIENWGIVDENVLKVMFISGPMSREEYFTPQYFYDSVSANKCITCSDKIKPEDEGLDPIEGIDVKIDTYLDGDEENTENIVFRYRNIYSLSSKEQITLAISDDRNIIFGCNRVDAGIGSSNVLFNEPYLKLRSIGVSTGGVVSLSYIKSILEKNIRCIEIVPLLEDGLTKKQKQLPSIVSLRLFTDGATSISASHCQAGQEENVFKFQKIPGEKCGTSEESSCNRGCPIMGGSRKRKNRKKTIRNKRTKRTKRNKRTNRTKRNKRIK